MNNEWNMARRNPEIRFQFRGQTEQHLHRQRANVLEGYHNSLWKSTHKYCSCCNTLTWNPDFPRKPFLASSSTRCHSNKQFGKKKCVRSLLCYFPLLLPPPLDRTLAQNEHDDWEGTAEPRLLLPELCAVSLLWSGVSCFIETAKGPHLRTTKRALFTS